MVSFTRLSTRQSNFCCPKKASKLYLNFAFLDSLNFLFLCILPNCSINDASTLVSQKVQLASRFRFKSSLSPSDFNHFRFISTFRCSFSLVLVLFSKQKTNADKINHNDHNETMSPKSNNWLSPQIKTLKRWANAIAHLILLKVIDVELMVIYHNSGC